MEDIKNKGMEVLLSLLLVSVFMSKGIFNLLFFTLIIFSIYKAFKYKDFYKEKIFFAYSGLMGIGLIFNLYSSGIKGLSLFLYNEKSLIFIPIFIILNLSMEQYEKIKKWIMVGGILSALYSGAAYFTPKVLGIKTLYFEYKKTHKMESFQNGIRWARLLTILVPFSYFNLEWVKKRIYKLSFVVLSVFFIWNIVINGQRAAILSAMFSMLIFFFMYIFSLKKHRIWSVIVIAIITISLGFAVSNGNKMIKERIVSIFDINNNISNKVRVGYWKIGTDMLKENHFFGIGSEKIPEEFYKFIGNQSEEYREKYFKYHEGTPFENSYINLAVENGLIYLLYLITVQVFIFIRLFKGYLKEEEKDIKIKLMIIFSILAGDRLFIMFYPGTDEYVEFLITFLIFYGYKLINRKEENL